MCVLGDVLSIYRVTLNTPPPLPHSILPVSHSLNIHQTHFTLSFKPRAYPPHHSFIYFTFTHRLLLSFILPLWPNCLRYSFFSSMHSCPHNIPYINLFFASLSLQVTNLSCTSQVQLISRLFLRVVRQLSRILYHPPHMSELDLQDHLGNY